MPRFALAAVDIDTDLPAGPLISESNILPGNVFVRTVIITKLNATSPLGLMLRLDRTNSTGNLESKILVRIQRLSNGQFLSLPGGGTEKTLESLYNYIDAANSNAFQFDSISGGASETFSYKLWFTFDSLADNNFQGKTTVFNLSAGIYSAPSTNSSSNNGGGGSNNGGGGGGGGTGGTLANPILRFLGLANGGATAGAETSNGEQQGIVEGQAGETPEVAGAVTVCESWPLWVWILALIIFTLNFWRNARKNYTQEKYRWIFPLVWTILAVAFWYFFDKCRIYQWFLYFSIIIAIVSHFVYLYFLRRKIEKYKKVEAKTEIE